MKRLNQFEAIGLITEIVGLRPHGIGTSEIAAEVLRRSGMNINRRTLQRYLRALIDAGRLVTSGHSVAKIYRIPLQPAYFPALSISTASPRPYPSPEAADGPGQLPALPSEYRLSEPEAYVPLSAEGQAVRDYIRRPLLQRTPVGYRREFLDLYEPGISAYLPDPLRSHLHSLGRTTSTEKPAGTYARGIIARLLVDLSWASSRLEGNTYSRLDTENLIELGKIAEGKDLIETQMILNHKAAIEMLVEEVDEIGFNAHTFKNLHAILSQDLMPDPDTSGRLRWRPVSISGTVYHPSAVPQVLEDCFHLILAKADAIPDPFEQAFFIMVHLPYLQPFEDVNKRVSRVGANIPLIRHNLCPLSFVDVPDQAYFDGTLGIYELNRIELLRDTFVWAYERSCQRYVAATQTMVAPDPLKIRYRKELILSVQEVVRGLRQPTPELVGELASRYALEPHRQAFANILSAALEQLHEGSVGRYRLRRSEYHAWRLGVRATTAP